MSTPFAALEALENVKEASRMSRLGSSLKSILSGKNMGTKETTIRNAGIGGLVGTGGAAAYNSITEALREEPTLLEVIQSRVGELGEGGRAELRLGRNGVHPDLEKLWQEKGAADTGEIAGGVVGGTLGAPIGGTAGLYTALAGGRLMGKKPYQMFRKTPGKVTGLLGLLGMLGGLGGGAYGGAKLGGKAEDMLVGGGAEDLLDTSEDVAAGLVPSERASKITGGILGGAGGAAAGGAGLGAAGLAAMRGLEKLTGDKRFKTIGTKGRGPGSRFAIASLLAGLGIGGVAGAVGGAKGGEKIHDIMSKTAADTDDESSPEDEKSRKDEEALRNRHLLLVLKRALQGGTAGAILGGSGASANEGGLTGGQGAGLGLIGGGAVGALAGAAEGGVKRKFGLDPLLQTVATARRP